MKPLQFVHTGNFVDLIPLQNVSGYVANHLHVPVTLISTCND